MPYQRFCVGPVSRVGQNEISRAEHACRCCQRFTGHSAGEPHTGETLVGRHACLAQPPTGSCCEHLQHQPFQGSTRCRDGFPCGANPSNVRLLQHDIQDEGHKMNVLMTIQSDLPLLGEFLEAQELSTDHLP